MRLIAKDGRRVKGAIWQVIAVFDKMLAAFEHARKQHPAAASQLRESDPSPASSLPSDEPPARRWSGRRVQPTAKATTTPSDASARYGNGATVSSPT